MVLIASEADWTLMGCLQGKVKRSVEKGEQRGTTILSNIRQMVLLDARMILPLFSKATMLIIMRIKYTPSPFSALHPPGLVSLTLQVFLSTTLIVIDTSRQLTAASVELMGKETSSECL